MTELDVKIPTWSNTYSSLVLVFDLDEEGADRHAGPVASETEVLGSQPGAQHYDPKSDWGALIQESLEEDFLTLCPQNLTPPWHPQYQGPSLTIFPFTPAISLEGILRDEAEEEEC